jgi:hypothetical protein
VLPQAESKRGTEGYVTTNVTKKNEYYNKQFLLIKSKCYNDRGGIISADVARGAHYVLGLPALIRASVVIFVIVCKIQLSVWFSYLLICTVCKS